MLIHLQERRIMWAVTGHVVSVTVLQHLAEESLCQTDTSLTLFPDIFRWSSVHCSSTEIFGIPARKSNSQHILPTFLCDFVPD